MVKDGLYGHKISLKANFYMCARKSRSSHWMNDVAIAIDSSTIMHLDSFVCIQQFSLKHIATPKSMISYWVL